MNPIQHSFESWGYESDFYLNFELTGYFDSVLIGAERTS